MNHNWKQFTHIIYIMIQLQLLQQMNELEINTIFFSQNRFDPF